MVDDPVTVARVVLGRQHQPTGRTKHSYGLPGDPEAVEVPGPVLLRIVQYEGTAGYYLFYCDAEGAELTDTFHDSVEAAKSQAEFEFNVRGDEWEHR